MEVWEYAYLYQFPTIKTGLPSQPGLTVYAVESMAGFSIMEGVHDTLAALNVAGSDGWLVQLPASWKSPAASEAARQVNEALGEFTTAEGWMYSMRRPGGGTRKAC